MNRVFIQLGRNGDLIMLLPCWLRIFEETGEKPVVVVAREFAPLLLGVSYVEADVINGHWYGHLPQVIEMAKLKYGAGGFVVTQCGGVGHGTDPARYPSFGEAMWAKAGFGDVPYGSLPLVFDRRDAEREQRLVAQIRSRSPRPMLLYNFRGTSSPFPLAADYLHRLRHYRRDFHLVDLGMLRASRLYDLLGLYDAAAGLVSIDTATLHLAAASKVPTLAFCRGGWSSAIPKPGAVRVGYVEAHKRVGVVDEFLAGLRRPVYAGAA